ncbi:MAG: ABC transporter ATP-binding protein [Desulfobacterales bacterium]|nr:MAG: ABC transporter ATP-binding protein [Desulfobacterales bacterium]
MSYLELKEVSKLFGKLGALQDINLQVNKGDIIGIVGPNGSGKTTLINVISGYYRPTQGTVLFDGKKISGKRPDQIAARGIARTFQSNVLFEGASVVESVMVSSYLQYRTRSWQAFFETRAYKDEHEAVVGRVLELLRMLDLFNDTFMPAEGLSHGYQRMLGIAIAMAANPRVLLLDEPTTGMNHEESMFVVENIRKISEQGVTVILIEHNMKVLLNLATRVVVLNFGYKIAEGKPEEVMNNQEVIDAYLGTEIV